MKKINSPFEAIIFVIFMFTMIVSFVFIILGIFVIMTENLSMIPFVIIMASYILFIQLFLKMFLDIWLSDKK